MHLQSLIITGFKSFPEARLEFPRGITAVVGPNGAGKSNIVDAMLWVLGEQSVKTLRSERMEDVIFNGTETEKPLGMAEVSLVVGGVTPQELEAVAGLSEEFNGSSELMVTRRLFRDGESEYFINKIPCRLKDIRSVFLAARAGTKGHTVIEQGNMDQILNASPQERRAFIEETAGTGRYKKQKAEALRKLNSAQQNILRVRDILAEVRRQLRSLERQAKQARDYQTLQHEMRALEIQLLTWDYRVLAQNRRQVEAELAVFEAQESARMAEETGLMAEQEKAKTVLLNDGEAVSRLQEDLRQLEHDMGHALTTIEAERGRLRMYEQQHTQAMEDRTRLSQESEHVQASMAEFARRVSHINTEIDSLTQSLEELERRIGDLSTRRSAIQEETDQARQGILEIAVEKTHAENQLKNLLEHRERLSRRLERLTVEASEYEGQREGVLSEGNAHRQRRQELELALQEAQTSREVAMQSIQTLDSQISEIDHTLVAQQTELAAAESMLRALRAVVHEEFGYGREGEVEETSLRGACHGICEAFAERLEVPQEFECAMEAVLGDRIRAWVVDNPAEVSQAITFLKQKGLGRAVFVPVHPWGAPELHADQDPPWWSALQHERSVIGRALALVRTPEELKQVAACLLGSVVIVKTFDTALDLVNRHRWPAHEGPVFVTLEGEVVDASGVISGGSAGESSGLLQRRREIRSLEDQVKALAVVVDESRQKRDTFSQRRDSAKTHVESLEEVVKSTEMQLLVMSKEEDAFTQAIEELEKKTQTVRLEQVAEEEESTRIEEEVHAARGRLLQLEQERGTRESRLETLAETLHKLERDASGLADHMTQSRLTLTTLQERRDHDQMDLARLEREEEARQTRLKELDQQLEDLFLHTQSSQEEQVRNESLFQELEQKKGLMQVELTSVEERYSQGLARTQELDKRLVEIRNALAASREARGAVEVRFAEVRTRLDALEATLTGTYGLSMEEVRQPASTANGVEVGHSDEKNPDAWCEQLQQIRSRLERMGPINLAAIEEHQELEERYRFLSTQEEDLSGSIRSLQEIIQRLNQTTSQMFTDTFHQLQGKFSEVFSALFAGGRAELVLVEPEGDQDGGDYQEEPGVDIVAQPPGKRLKNLSMLSGGEKSLTVLALLFASFLIKPSPFCILDEVDAPLDEVNVGRFAKFLSQMADRSQFLIITHNKRTMEVADSLFGVTMEEPGVSKFVSVRLLDLQAVS